MPTLARIGIFGGAFDPPHIAHLALVQQAMDQLALDQLRVVPTGDAWHKARPLSAAHHRLTMATLAFADLPKVVVDDRETRRAGPSYTIDTLRDIKALNPTADLFLIIGADQARKLTTWHLWQELVQTATICVAERDSALESGAAFIAPESLKSRFVALKLPLNPVSATTIRALVAMRQVVSTLVGEPVARYIAQHHLYSNH